MLYWCEVELPCDAEVEEDLVITELVAQLLVFIVELVELIDGMVIVLIVLRLLLLLLLLIILIIEFFFSFTFMFNVLRSLQAIAVAVANSFGLV
jgi:hypothetical protein